MKQKSSWLILFTSFLAIFSVNSASAQMLNDAASSVARAIALFLGKIEPVGNTSANEVLFIKILVFILLFAIINLILNRVPTFGDNKGICLLVAFIVSLISIRYMTTASLINFIWLPYGVLGMVISVALPFVIGFFFIEGFDEPVIRKVGWTAYLVIFAGLGYMRWNTLSTGGEWWQNLAWMYIAIAILSGILLLFDGQIRTYMFMSSLRGVQDVNKRAEAARITAQIEEDREYLARTTDSGQRRALEKRIKERNRTLRSILRG
jgi:hypothetical protein